MPFFSPGRAKKRHSRGSKALFLEGNLIDIVLPPQVPLLVADTAAPIRGGVDTAWKTAKLETGLEIMVPLVHRQGQPGSKWTPRQRQIRRQEQLTPGTHQPPSMRHFPLSRRQFPKIRLPGIAPDRGHGRQLTATPAAPATAPTQDRGSGFSGAGDPPRHLDVGFHLAEGRPSRRRL